MDNNFLESKEIINRNKQIILELALALNKELFDEKEISYKVFKMAEGAILKENKNIHQV